MRQVYPTSEIAHKWAHQTQSSARNPQGNLSFDGPRLFSYNKVVAVLRFKKKEIAALISEHRYSNTTTGHIIDARSAVSHLARFVVPDVEPLTAGGHGKNLDYLLGVASGELAKAKRAMLSSGVNWRRGTARAAYDDAIAYAKFFGIRRKFAPFPDVTWAAALERARAIESPDPIRDAKRFKARVQRQVRAEKQLAEYQAKLEQHRAQFADIGEAWRRGETNQLSIPAPEWWDKTPRTLRRQLLGQSWGRGHWAGARTADCLLRVNGDEIETSQGARIPVSHARHLWRAIAAVKESGQEYKRNGHTIHAGEYAVDLIEAEGTLHAGCHVIKYGELERLARTLDLV